MNIQILDSWLREYLETKASAQEIAKYLSLSGPSVEKVVKQGDDWVYEIELTTNRIDMVSVYGIAREAAAILPRSGIKAKLKPMKLASKPTRQDKRIKFNLKTSEKLTRRVMGVIMDEINNWETPDWMKERLQAAGIRSLGAPIDITNYVMMEVGHPTHVFDYDLVTTQKFILRESKKGEEVVSLENKKYVLPGGDIVIDDGTGKIIDLPGIIGTKNSVVNKDTKRILFFNECNDPAKIRQTSMKLAIRTMAATINEKEPDANLAEIAILRGLKLFEQVCGAKPVSKIYDIYYKKSGTKKVVLSYETICDRLGVEIKKTDISEYLQALEFEPKWRGNVLEVSIPSFRMTDIEIAEDIIEEIARIYGYHNLPSNLMAGDLPQKYKSTFDFERKVKESLARLGGIEIYTQSLVGEDQVNKDQALGLLNPMGGDSAFLRTSLKPSLVAAVKNNKAEEGNYHLFEMANVYLKRGNKNNEPQLPEERMMLAGIISYDDTNEIYNYRRAVGIVESMLRSLGIKEEVCEIGVIEKIKSNQFYYEFEINKLNEKYTGVIKYVAPDKFPAQIEDLTFILNLQTSVGKLVDEILGIKYVKRVKLMDIYENAFSFRIEYVNPKKTLENREVEKIRNKIIERVNNKFGGILKC